MAKITVDNKEIECRDDVPVLQAVLDSGWDVPHYCYHPSLSIVASCRLCLMEMKAPNPKTGELGWMPKLVPSCQTPVRDGMVVRFDSDVVRDNQKSCMEYFLLNHPLDCPVCDQAGECYLQDYSYKFGEATSRMVDPKLKNPKKDVGPRTLLYQDRCVMCTRCVRFTDEVSGTHELAVINRGSRSEIDVFPGLPLDNPMQGNVVDICPVGSLLDKDFLFAQRVWMLKGAPSVCAGCSTGCTIRVDHNDNTVYRLKPRHNPEVNDHWMCDHGRFDWKTQQDDDRLVAAIVARGQDRTVTPWDKLTAALTYRFEQFVAQREKAAVAVVLSPMMACEEAWLLVRFIRTVAPEATLVTGWVPQIGEPEYFPTGCAPEAARFAIRPEKCPNRRGVEQVVKSAGGATLDFDAFLAAADTFGAAWIVGGYPQKDWVSKEMAKALSSLELLVVQDMFANALTDAAEVVLPSASWLERAGTFMNHQGLLQPFERAVMPPDGGRSDGQYLYELAGFTGLFNADRVRNEMIQEIPEFADLHRPPESAAHQH
jgi:NADH-quinone oxidoreductase subunit G